jgi:hypothetical protein
MEQHSTHHKQALKNPFMNKASGNRLGEEAMDNKKQTIEAAQKRRKVTKETQLKWSRPRLSPLGVADGTGAGKNASTTEGFSPSGAPIGAVS